MVLLAEKRFDQAVVLVPAWTWTLISRILILTIISDINIDNNTDVDSSKQGGGALVTTPAVMAIDR